ncbi:Uncharacterised protein [Candidatus Venteria ishoeyi]|uniref:Uncharacterized protein n=1 Tax=Candidatus Venteria ishoeyi TaxID=1899563 RepID=A0A1H6F543_9GAMM|nr:Uncharacterised protein [Candidatus Venteria ishoeyi]
MDPFNVSIEMEVDGQRYPLAYAMPDAQGTPQMNIGYRFEQECQQQTDDLGNVTEYCAAISATQKRGLSLDLSLTEILYDLMASKVEDTLVYVLITLDPENQIKEFKDYKADNVYKLPLMFLVENDAANARRTLQLSVGGREMFQASERVGPDYPQEVFNFQYNNKKGNDHFNIATKNQLSFTYRNDPIRFSTREDGEDEQLINIPSATSFKLFSQVPTKILIRNFDLLFVGAYFNFDADNIAATVGDLKLVVLGTTIFSAKSHVGNKYKNHQDKKEKARLEKKKSDTTAQSSDLQKASIQSDQVKENAKDEKQKTAEEKKVETERKIKDTRKNIEEKKAKLVTTEAAKNAALKKEEQAGQKLIATETSYNRAVADKTKTIADIQALRAKQEAAEGNADRVNNEVVRQLAAAQARQAELEVQQQQLKKDLDERITLNAEAREKAFEKEQENKKATVNLKKAEKTLETALNALKTIRKNLINSIGDQPIPPPQIMLWDSKDKKGNEKWVKSKNFPNPPFKKTFMVGPVPITIKAGIKGEIGLTGTLSLEVSNVIRINTGPVLSVAAFAEASLDFAAVSMGIEVSLTLLKIELRAQGDAQLLPSYPMALLRVQAPLSISFLDGSVSLFVRVNFCFFQRPTPTLLLNGKVLAGHGQYFHPRHGHGGMLIALRHYQVVKWYLPPLI